MNLVTPLVELRNVRLEPQPPALPKDVSLVVRPGEFLVIQGANGMGKSFLLDVMAGLTVPSEGEVYLHGKALKKYSESQKREWRRRLGLISSFNSLLPDYTLGENLRLAAQSLGVPREKIEYQVEEALNLCGLKEIQDQKVEHLSSGQKKRALIARSLLNRPELILADDPFNSLDAYFKEALLRLFSSLPSFGYAIVLTSPVPVTGSMSNVTTLTL